MLRFRPPRSRGRSRWTPIRTQGLWAISAFLGLAAAGFQAAGFQGDAKKTTSPLTTETKSCVYVAKPTAESPDPGFELHEGCAILDETGGLKILPSHLQAISFDDDLASVLIADQWYYLRPDGSMLSVPTFDNGPDYWRDGLVRTRRDGRIGFAGRDFELVIEPLYDWAWPFEDGLALVCRGCRIEEGPGEHHAVVGGRWGVIDRSGREVLAVAHSAEEARRFLE